MKAIVWRFGLLALALLILFELNKYSLIFKGSQNEWLVIGFALAFLLFGFFANRLSFQSKNHPTNAQEILIKPDIEDFKKLGISNREYQVLQEIAHGLSNQEIAEKLFISESTVKTHVSNLLLKLDAKRRTQALTNAKKMGII